MPVVAAFDVAEAIGDFHLYALPDEDVLGEGALGDVAFVAAVTETGDAVASFPVSLDVGPSLDDSPYVVTANGGVGDQDYVEVFPLAVSQNTSRNRACTFNRTNRLDSVQRISP